MEATEAMKGGIMLLLFLATFPFYRHPGCVCACTFTFPILLDRIATTICILERFSILSFRSIYPMKILTLVFCCCIATLQNFRKPTKKWQNTTFTLNVLSGCARYQWIASAPRLWLRLQIGISYGINLWSAPFNLKKHKCTDLRFRNTSIFKRCGSVSSRLLQHSRDPWGLETSQRPLETFLKFP